MRDFFAAAALTGQATAGWTFDQHEEMAVYCYHMADSMLAIRAGKQVAIDT